MTTLIQGLSALWLLPALCLAQVDTWERVRLIEPGKKATVRLASGQSVSGRMQAWSPEGITLEQGKSVRQIAKSEISRVQMHTGMTRGRRAAWAAAIGGGAGAGVYGALCGAVGDCDAAAFAGGGAIVVGGFSALIAALIPEHKETIYSTSKR